MISLQAVIKRMAKHRPKDFVAPIPAASIVDVFSWQDDIPYWFRVPRGTIPGWWILSPTEEEKVVIVEMAQPRARLDYLFTLPKFFVIVIFRFGPHTWMVTPWNASDAGQRGWPSGQPRLIHLVHHTVQPFDVIVGRQMGQILLFENIALSLKSSEIASDLRRAMQSEQAPEGLSGDWNRAFDMVVARWKAARLEMEAAEQQQRQQEKARRIDEHLRGQFKFMNAELLTVHEAGEGYRVAWRHDGHEYTMDFRSDMRLATAGVCLDGTDSQHNAASIVEVMRRHRELGRTY